MGMIILTAASAAAFGQRDFLTAEEVEIVRDAQRIDERIGVLIHSMDRRYAQLAIDVNAPKKKEKSEWGPLPTGDRLELLTDIKRIMQKAIDDIDNLADRPAALILNAEDEGKKNMTFNELFGKAVRDLAAASRRYDPAVKAEASKDVDKQETGALLAILDMCSQIQEAVQKLPPEIRKGKN
jgi:hypothetical protein